MKRCPTCQRTYTDDSLSFCLQDGATLLSASNATTSYDPEATLRIAAPGSTSDQPTEVFSPRAAPTIASPQPAPATTPQQRLDTRETQSPVAAAPAAAAPPASSSRALMAGVVAIVALLLALVGIGVALLLRSSPESNRNTTNVDAGASSANKNTNANVNTNNKANDNANVSASPVPTTNDSAPVVNANAQNRNTSTTPEDIASRAEAKILRDAPLTERDLAGLTSTELRRLRNTVYARHGRTFETPELQRYFDTRPWYRPRSDYSDQYLTPTDRANVKLIQAEE